MDDNNDDYWLNLEHDEQSIEEELHDELSQMKRDKWASDLRHAKKSYVIAILCTILYSVCAFWYAYEGETFSMWLFAALTIIWGLNVWADYQKMERIKSRQKALRLKEGN